MMAFNIEDKSFEKYKAAKGSGDAGRRSSLQEYARSNSGIWRGHVDWIVEIKD
jgi:hypothetical protein